MENLKTIPNTITTGSETEFQSDYSLRSRPLSLRVISKFINVLGHISPRSSAKIIKTLFLTPHRRTTKTLELGVESFNFIERYNDKLINMVQAGSGPVILLVHGWASGSYRFSKIADTLISNGYQILAVDLPAHGQSSGKQTNLRECGDLVNHLVDKYGPFHGIVAHSFGGPATLLFPKQKHDVGKIVTIGSPTTTSSFFDPFFEYMQLNQNLKQPFVEELEKLAGMPMTQFAPAREDFVSNVPLMLIHDKNDQTVPVSQSYSLHNIAGNSELLITSKLGHTNILYDEDVLNKIIKFIE